THYAYEDLLSFYDWAPATLPQRSARVGRDSVEPSLPRDYCQPLPELLADIRSRLDSVPPDTMEQVHTALKEKPLDFAASLLWKAGASFTSAELYEFRKTLFPPNALVDGYTSGPPVLRPEAAGLMD